ncbi:hypothetical protein [Shigella flexneri]
MIYATVGGHEAMVSMVALGCAWHCCGSGAGKQPEPVRNRVMI